MKYKPDSLQENFDTKNMVLVVRNEKAKFISKQQLEIDSLLTATKRVAKPRDYDFLVINNLKEKKIHKFTNILTDFYRTTISSPTFNWKLTNETKKVENYSCQKATLDYAGRSWEAWFTTDILLQVGPYIFGQLPGLIVEMKDSRNHYFFQLTAVSKDNKTDVDFIERKTLDVTEEQLKQLKLKYYNDPYQELRSGNRRVIFQDEDGNTITPDYKEMTKTEQKSLKTKNNPIELSEAIVYP